MFHSLEGGNFTPNDGFYLIPQFRNSFTNQVKPSKLKFNFRQSQGEMYLLEINMNFSSHESVFGFDSIYFSIDGRYQNHLIVDGKVTVIWEASSDNNAEMLLTQVLPYNNNYILTNGTCDFDTVFKLTSCINKIESIKIRNITE